MSKLGTNPTPKMNFYPEYVPATRPAAPVEGLETVGYVTTSPTGAEVFQRKPLVPGHGQFGYKQDAVVTRSQADELLAAERAETMRQVKHWSELYKQQHYRAEKAEAIIAAKDAKIADLENELSSFRSSFKEQTSLKSNNAALTARVKELAEALEPFAKYGEDYFDKDNNNIPLPDEQGVGWIYMNYGHFRKARAALEDRP